MDPTPSPAAIFSEAQAYERFMGRWSRRLAPLFVEFAGVRDGDAVLDVGSGTGALASTAARLAPSSRVVGVDQAAPYVALAQSQYGSALVRFETGDARQMEFDAGTFGVAMSMLVLNFIPGGADVVREMARVTRSGGVVAAAVWDYGDGMDMLRVFWDEAAVVSPAAAEKDERHMPLCRPGELAALWSAVGLRNVVEEALTVDTVFESFDDFWVPFLGKQGPAGAFAASLSDDRREGLRRRLLRRLVNDAPDAPIPLRARAWAVRGAV